jgi:hypothetical protein
MRKLYQQVILWNFLILIAGFPLISFLPGVYNITNTQVFTIPYRLLCVISASITIIIGIRIKIYSLINYKHKILFIFFTVYLLRVTYDLYFSPYSNSLKFEFPEKATFFLYIIGITLIPMISILTIINIDLLKLARYFFYLTLLAIVFALINNNVNFNEVVEDRLSANTTLSSISYGQLGVTGFILALYLWSQVKTKVEIVLYIIGGILSLYTIVIAGSRSPFVVLLICTSLVLLYFRSKNIVSKFFSRALLLIIAFSIVVLPGDILKLIGRYSSTSENRISNTFNKSADQFSGRDFLYEDALNQFFESPVIGTTFVLNRGSGAGWYPHNVILEAFMALGIIGGLVYLYLTYNALRNSFFLLKYFKNTSWLSLIFIEIVIVSTFSGSLYGTYSLWIMMFLLLVSPNYYKKKSRLKNRQNAVDYSKKSKQVNWRIVETK